MRVYKERQYLIFELGGGNTVKYDFAQKVAIGKSGKVVKDLKRQLTGITVEDLIENCEDIQYAKFLKFIQKRNKFPCSNIGTLLSKVWEYKRYEQLFSAGFDDIMGGFRGTVNDIPKGLVKICRTHHLTLSDNLVNFYKQNPDAYNIPYQMEFVSLDDRNIYDILTATVTEKEYYGTRTWEYHSTTHGAVNILISKYGYNAKVLFTYMDFLKTYEALSVENIIKELHDYAYMLHEVSSKFDKYPRHFLTTHAIANRNYTRLKQTFDEKKFTERIDLGMEKTFGEFKFIYPKSTQEIKDEAVTQNNCVASYIERVIAGGCHILFLRYAETPNTSLVTIEVRDGKIVQARQRFNDPVTEKQQEVIDKWNKWYAKTICNKESEE